MSPEMHICYALNEGYVDYCCVSMVSVLENNRNYNITFHILTDQLSLKKSNQLKECAGRYQINVIIYEVDDKKLTGQKTSWSKYSWYRIFAGDLLPLSVDKILYLDCDVIVESDISELFGAKYIKDDEWSIAGVADIMSIFPSLFERVGYPQERGYICAGVLMMNLNYFRKYNLSEAILEFALKNPNKIQFPDQDALNCICEHTKIELPLKYGILDPFFRNKTFIAKYKEQVKECLSDPRIVHFAGCNPWIAEYQHHYYADLFWKYVDLSGIVIKRRHCYSGRALLSLRVKRIFSYLGIKKYKKYRLIGKPGLEMINKLLESI